MGENGSIPNTGPEPVRQGYESNAIYTLTGFTEFITKSHDSDKRA